jgi:hypothetical protein
MIYEITYKGFFGNESIASIEADSAETAISIFLRVKQGGQARKCNKDYRDWPSSSPSKSRITKIASYVVA